MIRLDAPGEVLARTGAPVTTIRRLEGREHSAYRALRLECLQRHPEFFGTTYAESVATSLPFEHHIYRQSPDYPMFGAFVGGALSGICGFQREHRARARHRGELVQLYVVPGVARQGIGSRLVGAVLTYAMRDPTLSQVVLSVAADNRRAIALYERAGFHVYGRLNDYFRTGTRSTEQLFMVCARG